jgi:DTW domain-containing protein
LSLRKKTSARCPSCRMRRELCLCEEMPRLALSTRVVIVSNRTESLTPTNTAHLAARALMNSALLIRGERDLPCDVEAELRSDGTTLLLFPEEGATPLDEELLRLLPRPWTLVVPDGNWRRASKMCRRDPAMRRLLRVTVADRSPSSYAVRREIKAHGLATIEAVARALGVMEGAEAREALERIFHLMVERTMRSRGA